MLSVWRCSEPSSIDALLSMAPSLPANAAV
eukprot:COSAG03_NODE_17781_length_368_cov_0.814126_1_plen_29_part_01